MWKTTVVLYCTVLADLLGFGIMIPLLPYLAFRFGASSASLGVMATAFSLFQMMGNITLGLASDRFGRKRVLCACLFGSAVSYLAFGLASSLETFILFRALSGFFSGTVGCAQAYVTATVPAKDRGQHLGYIGACIGAGFACGPGLGGVLAHTWGFDGPCFFAAGLCFVNAVAAVLFLREPDAAHSSLALAAKREPLLTKQSHGPAMLPQQSATREPAATGHQAQKQVEKRSMTLSALLKERPQCFPVLVSTAAYYTAFAVFDAAGALFFHDDFGMTAGQFGGLSTLSGLGALVIQRFCVRGAIDRLGEVGAGAAAHFCRLVAYLLVAVCHASWAPYLMGLLISGGSILAPCSATLLSTLSPEEARGGVLGLNQSFAAFGRVLGPIVAAVIYPHRAEAIWYAAVACSLFGAVALLCVKRCAEEFTAAAAQAAAKVVDVEQPEEAEAPRTPTTAASDTCDDRTPSADSDDTEVRQGSWPALSVAGEEGEAAGAQEEPPTTLAAHALPKVPGFPLGGNSDKRLAEGEATA